VTPPPLARLVAVVGAGRASNPPASPDRGQANADRPNGAPAAHNGGASGPGGPGRGRRPHAAALCSAVLVLCVAWPCLRAGASVPTEFPALDLADRSARLLGVRAGDLIDLGTAASGPWRTFRIAHVYRPAEYPTEISRTRVDVRLHLADLEALEGGQDEVDSIVVRSRAPARPAELASRLEALPIGTRAYTSAELAARNSTTFEVIARFHRAISAVTILTSSVFLFTIMTLRGEEMRQQVGLMRLIGLSARTVAAAVLLIASGIALAGSVVGVGLGYALSAATNAGYRQAFDTTLVFSQITLPLLAEAVALSVALGVAAGAVAAWRLLRPRALEQLGR